MTAYYDDCVEDPAIIITTAIVMDNFDYIKLEVNCSFKAFPHLSFK